MSYKKRSISITLAQAAELVHGKPIGDLNSSIQGICSIEQPVQGCISMLSRSPRNAAILRDAIEAGIAALIIPPHLYEILTKEECSALGLIVHPTPMQAMISIVQALHEEVKPAPGISPKSDIHEKAVIGANVSIQAFCSVGANAIIEDDVVLYSHVVIYHGARIGARSVLHAGATVREYCEIGPDSLIQNGAVIGSDGFGYYSDPTLGLRPIPQVGRVQMSERVDIGANTCIDRGAFGDTRIATGAKLDNLVQIGHNVQIGEHSIICGQVAMAGSSQIGRHVTIAGQAGVADHTHITDNVRLGARSGVFTDITAPGDYAGFPALRALSYRKQMKALTELPSIYRKLKRLISESEK